MPSEQIRFILEAIGSIAGIAALIAIALELQRARKADERDFLFHTYEKFEEISKEWAVATSMEFSTLDELILLTINEEHENAFLKIFNFWDLFTKTVRDKAISKTSAFEHFGIPFIRYYDKFSLAFHELDEIKGGYNNFESFDWFYEELTRNYPGESESVKRRETYNAKVKAQAS
jgi:hypothetical protein